MKNCPALSGDSIVHRPRRLRRAAEREKENFAKPAPEIQSLSNTRFILHSDRATWSIRRKTGDPLPGLISTALEDAK